MNWGVVREGYRRLGAAAGYAAVFSVVVAGSLWLFRDDLLVFFGFWVVVVALAPLVMGYLSRGEADGG